MTSEEALPAQGHQGTGQSWDEGHSREGGSETSRPPCPWHRVNLAGGEACLGDPEPS